MTIFNLDNISFSYGNNPVLHNLNFSLKPNTFYGLVGPNGSGKTTLLDLLLGNLTPASGTIQFKSSELRCWNWRFLAKEIALVPQEFNFSFEFTVEEMVLMGRHPYIPRFSDPTEEDKKIVSTVMEELDITNLADRLVTQLSGGEKQRVLVARALAQDTEVLVLDEATSNLDIHHTIHIFKTIKKRVTNQNGTVIAAIHDLNFAAAFCDEIILINQGEIITIGPPKDVLSPVHLKDIFSVTSQMDFNEFCQSYQISFRYDDEYRSAVK